MKSRDIKDNSNHINGKSVRGIKRLPFPLILCIAIILATSLIYFSVATTDGGADNSGGFSFRRAKTHQSNNEKVEDKHSKSRKGKSEINSADNASTSSDQTKNDTESRLASKKKDSKNPKKKGKTWVPPVYKYVNHPAETRTVTTYTCKGGTFTSMEALREEQQKYIRRNHLPGCDGTFSNVRENTKTEVVKKAWTEKVLVKEGYWK